MNLTSTRNVRDPSQLSPFTRSKCAGGQYCSATCEIHRRKRRPNRASPILNSEFSDDDYCHFGTSGDEIDEDDDDYENDSVRRTPTTPRKTSRQIHLAHKTRTNQNNVTVPNKHEDELQPNTNYYSKAIIIAILILYIIVISIFYDLKLRPPKIAKITETRSISQQQHHDRQEKIETITEEKCANNLQFHRDELEKLVHSQLYEQKHQIFQELKLQQQQNILKEKDVQDCFSVEHIKQMIKKALDTYDADKTDLADYALESSGGVIVTTRCSQNYAENNVKFSLNGILPLFYTSNTPRLVISPSVYPGECWSFSGSRGHLVIKLSRTILPTMFTYEHVRRQLSPDLSISSAPKNVRVLSLKDASDTEGIVLGEYVFDDQGEPLQQYRVQNPNAVPTQFIQLDVLSNHGEMQYTCLYRFRVHGKLFPQLEGDTFRAE